VVDGVYSYNSNINNYDNESAALQLSSTPKSTVDLIANTVGLDGSVDMFERINLPMVNLGFAYDGLGGHSEVYDTTTPDGIAAIAAVTDQDRTTGKAFTHQYTGGPAASDLQIFATYKPQSINPSILNQVLTESYANLYFVVDFSLAPQSPLTGPIPFIPWNRSNLTSVAWQTTDITGCIMNGSTMPSDIPTDSSLGPYNTLPELGGSVSNINFLQNNLVKSNYGLNSISLFDRQSTTAGKTYKAIFKITDLAPRSIFMRPEITEIKLMFNFNSNYGSSGGIIYSAILTINEIAVIGERSVNILTGNIFASTTGETIASDGATFANTVYKSFQHIMEDYDGIPNAMIDYGDLPESRDEGEEPGWPVSRTLTEQKNSRDYLNELCQHSFVAMFSGRTGMRTLRALSDGTGSLSAKWTHNGSNIVAGTLGDYAKTDVSSLFNCFYLQYAYDPGSQQYIRGFNVNSLLIGYTSDGVTPWEFPDAATPDPDGSGNPYWWAFFSGLQVSATDPSVGHDDAASIWNLCQAAYLQNRCSKPVQGDISELPWFTDSLIYDSSDSSGSGVTSPAYMLLKMLATWATTQKETVSYCIPITATTIATEMIDIVAFYDNLITNAKKRDGWITGIEYDCNNDQIKITLTLQPLELVGA
jgi:hypothetical protein